MYVNRGSLFCVCDKVDVYGYTFAWLYCITNSLGLALNLTGIEDEYHLFFYILGYPYFFFFMTCLTTYRSSKEFCFYCLYAIIENTIVMWHIIIFDMKTFPWLYFIICGAFFGLVVGLKAVAAYEKR